MHDKIKIVSGNIQNGFCLNRLLGKTLDLPPESITDDLRMKDTESWDSLKHMALITAIESTYSLELSFEEIVKMQSVAQIKAVLQEKGVEDF
jgi:acyl carrier protein